MNKLTIYWDARVLDHDTGSALHETAPSPWITETMPHVEGPTRIRAMYEVLRNGPLAPQVSWGRGRLASEDELRRVHPLNYVQQIRDLSAAGGGWVTSTTRAGALSFEPLQAAAGTALAATEAVLAGTTKMAYALIRPPGHHAQVAQADGYCFFNHVALAADLALRTGARRVMTFDWDVHHGNGTQDIFYARDDVLTTSIHMNHGAWGPTHPQTGYPDEVGTGAGTGYNVNVALPLGVGDAAYLRAFDEILAPIARRYRPDILIAASGQDASAFDPNGRHNVSMQGYYQLAQRLSALAEETSDGRIVLIQEGGYNPTYAPYCLLATLEGLVGATPTPDPLAYIRDQDMGVDEALTSVINAHSPTWPNLIGEQHQ
jgi:acetoin utilization deacetylase AcuC-like enzyme